jgi:hypothetical protein
MKPAASGMKKAKLDRWKIEAPTFGSSELRPCVHYGHRACPWESGAHPLDGHLPKRDSPADFIFIPLAIRQWEVASVSMSARLLYVLGGMECRVWGDLHGLRLTDLLRRRNCGKATLAELVRLVRNLQQGNWGHWRGPAAGCEVSYEI